MHPLTDTLGSPELTPLTHEDTVGNISGREDADTCMLRLIRSAASSHVRSE